MATLVRRFNVFRITQGLFPGAIFVDLVLPLPGTLFEKGACADSMSVGMSKPLPGHHFPLCHRAKSATDSCPLCCAFRRGCQSPMVNIFATTDKAHECLNGFLFENFSNMSQCSSVSHVSTQWHRLAICCSYGGQQDREANFFTLQCTGA